jgi:DNA-binding NtrC family response regulator
MDRTPAIGTAFRAAIVRTAATHAHVLLSGDVGSAAEQLARDLHAQSDRKGHPFAGLRLVGLSADRLDAELFGLVKGERNAPRDRTGLLALVGRGTLFLDDITQLPPAIQQRLHRALSTGVLRAGGREWPVHGRVVSSARDGMLSAVQRGEFLSELYFRLAGVVLEIPALRLRPDDVPLMTLEALASTTGDVSRFTSIEDGALKVLTAWPWNGGSRELQSVVDHIAARARGPMVQASDLPPQLQRVTVVHPTVQLGELVPLDDVERAHITMVLQRVGGNKARAATILQIGRKTLYRKLGGWGIPLDDVGAPPVVDRASSA